MTVPRVVTRLNKATVHALESVGGLLQDLPDFPCMVVTETQVVIQGGRRQYRVKFCQRVRL